MPSNPSTRPASVKSARDDERAEKTTEILKKIRTLEIKTRGLVETAFAGDYHSVFKGRGMNFEDVREYQPGDEIRAIDWNVTARMGSAFVKKFTEERELTVMLVVDVSASGNFGSTTQSKRELAAEVACLLAFSAIRNNDKVGLLLFTDRVELFIPPKKGRSHTLRIIREILFFEPQGRGTEPGTGTRLSEQNCDSPRGCIFHLGFSSAGFLARARGERAAARFHSDPDPGRTRKSRCQTSASLPWRMPRRANRSRSTRQIARRELVFTDLVDWIRNGAYAHAPAEQCRYDHAANRQRLSAAVALVF